MQYDNLDDERAEEISRERIEKEAHKQERFAEKKYNEGLYLYDVNRIVNNQAFIDFMQNHGHGYGNHFRTDILPRFYPGCNNPNLIAKALYVRAPLMLLDAWAWFNGWRVRTDYVKHEETCTKRNVTKRCVEWKAKNYKNYIYIRRQNDKHYYFTIDDGDVGHYERFRRINEKEKFYTKNDQLTINYDNELLQCAANADQTAIVAEVNAYSATLNSDLDNIENEAEQEAREQARDLELWSISQANAAADAAAAAERDAIIISIQLQQGLKK